MQQRHVVVSGNILRGQGLTGSVDSGAIRAYFVDAIVIAGNSVSDFGGAGLRMAGTINGAVVTGNVFGDGTTLKEPVVRDVCGPTSTRTYTGNRSHPTAGLPDVGMAIGAKPTTGDIIASSNRFEAKTEYDERASITAIWP